jgi:hypothetical protein
MSGNKRNFGMSWEEILQYDRVIKAIAYKYAGERTLAEDAAQEVRLRLHTDRRLDTSKFDPAKKDAAIRNTIRNKTLKVLSSRKLGRWQFESLDALVQMGVQIDSDNNVMYPKHLNTVIEKDPADDA